MPWIESHTILGRHRKVLALAKAMRLKPAHLIGHLHLLWHAALEQQENGDLSKWSDDMIAESSGCPPCGAPQWVRLLQEHEWLDDKKIHDWLEYAGAYLISKYHKNRRDRLVKIWSLYGRVYGLPHRIPTESPPNPHSTLPNRTLPNLSTTTIVHDFMRLWSKYPKRIGKKQAERHFHATVKTDSDFANIEQALSNYLISDRVRRGYIQNGATWFNNWRDWIDYVEMPSKVGENNERVTGTAGYKPSKYAENAKAVVGVG